MKRFLILLTTIFITASCSIHETVRVTPESLISSTSENVSFGLVSDTSIISIVNWIKDDRPTDAELSCSSKSDMLCLNAQEVLRENSIPFKLTKAVGGSDSVTLFYERVSARSCSNRGFGCATAVNSLQMVPNHTHFVKPPLSENQDAATAVDTYNRHMNK